MTATEGRDEISRGSSFQAVALTLLSALVLLGDRLWLQGTLMRDTQVVSMVIRVVA